MHYICKIFLIACTFFSIAAFAADSIRIEIDAFSGLPNPWYILSDTQNVRVISERILYYEHLQATSWPGCPEPLSGLGYRGVRITRTSAVDTATVTASNGALLVYQDPPTPAGAVYAYCDYFNELEGIAVRACISEGLITQNVRDIIPDTLRKPVRFDGIVTVMMPAANAGIDFSMLRTYQAIPIQDPSLEQDIEFRIEASACSLACPWGIRDMGLIAGMPEAAGTTLEQATVDSLLPLCRSAFANASIAVPSEGYAEGVPLGTSPQHGQCCIARTSEAGYAALVIIGNYIGDIERIHYYFTYSSDTIPGTTSIRVPRSGKDRHAIALSRRMQDAGASQAFDIRGRRLTPARAQTTAAVIMRAAQRTYVAVRTDAR